MGISVTNGEKGAISARVYDFKDFLFLFLYEAHFGMNRREGGMSGWDRR